MDAEEGGGGSSSSFFFFPVPDVKIGTWGPWERAESFPKQAREEVLRFQPSSRGGGRPSPSPRVARRAANPRSQTLGFLSLHRCTYLESADHSDALKSVAFQRKPTRTGGGADPFFLQVRGPRGAPRRASPWTVCTHSFQALEVPRSVLGILYTPHQGNHTLPGVASPSQG